MQKLWRGLFIFLSAFSLSCSQLSTHSLRAPASSESLERGQCEQLLCLSEKSFFDEARFKRVGLEVEFSGLEMDEVLEILQEELGGKLERVEEQDTFYYKLKKSRLTRTEEAEKVWIHFEGNETNPDEKIKDVSKIKTIEVTTSPIHWEGVKIFDSAISRLKKAGAIGTTEDNAVSIQVNIEVATKDKPQFSVETLLSLLRNYYSEENFAMIEKEIPLPQVRKPYVGAYSEEMMKRILDPDYRPSLREFYNDFFYRQSAEYLGYEGAWSESISRVESFIRKNLKEDDFDKILKVFKWNDVRISSILIQQLPDLYMSKYLVKTGWVAPNPIIEFRRFNNDFNILGAVKSVQGLVSKSEEGVFDFSEELASYYGLKPFELERIKKIPNKEEPFVVRQFLGERTSGNADFDDIEDFEYGYKRSTPIFVEAYPDAKAAYVIPGESVVWHRMPFTSEAILGKYNPALVNADLSAVLDHKYVEAAFWEKYAPGAMGKTTLLSELIKPGMKPDQIKEALDKAYPNGWVMKGVWDNATQASFLVTNDTDISEKIKVYKDNLEDYLDYMKRMDLMHANSNPDVYVRVLRERPEFTGHRLNRFFKEPEFAIVQERLAIKEEYRVEVIAGKVLAKGTTIPRYQYEYPDSDDWMNDPNIKRVEEFAQSVVDKLPPELRGMTFGMDIAALEDGSVRMIESNAQGNSGFLAYDVRSVKELDKFLLKYPRLVEEGEISLGMSREDQVKYIRKFIESELNLDLDSHYPHLVFKNDGVTRFLRLDTGCTPLMVPLLLAK